MENKIEILFEDEDFALELDIKQPDLAKVIHEIVSRHLVVSKENVSIRTKSEEFDTEEFLDILVNVYEEFSDEINQFFENIQKDIKTYYEMEELSEEVINRIKEEAVATE